MKPSAAKNARQACLHFTSSFSATHFKILGAVWTAVFLNQVVFIGNARAVEYEFSAPNGPLIWDFSGWYPSLGAQIFQNHDGSLAYSVYGYPSNVVTVYGQVTADQGSVGFDIPLIAQYNDPGGSGYWWAWGLSLDLTQDKRSLSGFRQFTVMISPSLYPLVRDRWYPHSVVPGINYFGDLVTVPLPDGADGHWHLDLDTASDGTRIPGTASIMLASSNIVPFQVSGTNTTVTKSIMKLQNPSGISSLQIVALGPELALQSMHGTVGGQPVDYDSPVAANYLSLLINGSGTVKSVTNRQVLEVGRDYTLNALPRPGNLFSNWMVAGFIVTSPTLRFTMCSNLTTTANFVTNFFIPLNGVYNGLFYETNGMRQPSAGFFTLTLATSGGFSGSLSLAGGTHSFSGRFDVSGKSQVQVRRGGKPALTARLEMDFAEPAIHGTVSDGTWNAELFADRAGPKPATNYEGVYTLVIPGDDPSADSSGDGYATFWIDYYGMIHATGKLADGTSFSRSVKISQHGLWPLYVPLYGNRGSVISWICFTNQPATSLGGDLIWFKPANSTGKIYPAGFTNQTSAAGSSFWGPGPSNGRLQLNFTNGVLILAGGNLPFALTNTFNGNGTATGTNQVKLTWNVISGQVNGSFLHPATGRNTPLQGVILQNQNVAQGFFLGTNQSGSFTLHP